MVNQTGDVHTQQGFSYLVVLFLVATLGLTLAATGSLWHVAQQREKERELLYIGKQYRLAITQYYERSPGGAKQFPKTLADLLQDNRQITPQHHLRKLYRDPITNTTEWGLIAGPNNTITGVYSLSDDAPIKQSNFDETEQDFTGQAQYSGWKFAYVNKATKPSTSQQTPPKP